MYNNVGRNRQTGAAVFQKIEDSSPSFALQEIALQKGVLMRLEGLKVYAFGDSIVYGHTLPEKSFTKMLADQYGWELYMGAVNGATVIHSDNEIYHQIATAPAEAPDVIIMNGYTNDAYAPVLEKLGTVGQTPADTTTFCGCFEEILGLIRSRWGQVPVFYVTIHRSAARDWEVQTTLRGLAMEMCKNAGVHVVDAFTETELDTRNEDMMANYIIDGAGSHPNEAACKQFYMPIIEKAIQEYEG